MYLVMAKILSTNPPRFVPLLLTETAKHAEIHLENLDLDDVLIAEVRVFGLHGAVTRESQADIKDGDVIAGIITFSPRGEPLTCDYDDWVDVGAAPPVDAGA